MLNNKSILITGGTGSLGKKLTEIIIKNYSPKRLVIFSRDEYKQHEMEQVFPTKKYHFIRYFIGDIRDYKRLQKAFRKIEYVIHCAALKQVPAAEYNPFEVIKTNVVGAQNIIDAAIDCDVEKVIALSTDKAANPINLYGATKLCSDKLFLAAQNYAGVDCKFAVVRYGNVFGSRGSVIPLFQKQAETGEVTLTDEKMTRFCITIDEAANFVLKCLDTMKGRELFVPKIPSMKIIDLIKVIAPEAKIKQIGIRPGEKIHEMLISKDDARYTYEYDDHFEIIYPSVYAKIPDGITGKLLGYNKEYVSNKNPNWITVKKMKELLDI
jgi:UDP-N-acetylglucosamine 4,6-dehydratase/5-epimerase